MAGDPSQVGDRAEGEAAFRGRDRECRGGDGVQREADGGQPEGHPVGGCRSPVEQGGDRGDDDLDDRGQQRQQPLRVGRCRVREDLREDGEAGDVEHRPAEHHAVQDDPDHLRHPPRDGRIEDDAGDPAQQSQADERVRRRGGIAGAARGRRPQTDRAGRSEEAGDGEQQPGVPSPAGAQAVAVHAGRTDRQCAEHLADSADSASHLGRQVAAQQQPEQHDHDQRDGEAPQRPPRGGGDTGSRRRPGLPRHAPDRITVDRRRAAAAVADPSSRPSRRDRWLLRIACPVIRGDHDRTGIGPALSTEVLVAT